jgi:7,8-dihydropterin-6-yl-methyl-4-(beta-D-ribofuranosyl)aminobenzene 5'-phosphate synthase
MKLQIAFVAGAWLAAMASAQQPVRSDRESEQAATREGTVAGAKVRLTILCDNAVLRPGVSAVWGFACLVETRGHAVLFDTGADPSTLKNNLIAMNVDPGRIESVVLSHRHGDHTRGVPGIGTSRITRVYTPRDLNVQESVTSALQSAGLTPVPVTRATSLFAGVSIAEPMHFDIRLPSSPPTARPLDQGWEQCLTIDMPEGLVVLVGCSHPGILPMLKEVKRRTGRPLYLAIGGFHLAGVAEEEVRQIATDMKALGIARVCAAHCSGESAVHVFRSIFGERFVSGGVGRVLECPL